MRHFVLLFLMLGTLTAHAQVDAVGRAIDSGYQWPPPTEMRANASLGGSRAATTPTFVLMPYQARSVNSRASAVAIGDVSDDGRPDVVLTTKFSGAPDYDYHVFAFHQNGSGSLDSPTRYPFLQSANETGLVLTDLDKKYGLDVAVGGYTGITRFLSQPDGTLSTPRIVQSQTAIAIVALQLRKNTVPDLVSFSPTGGNVFQSDGEGGLSVSDLIIPQDGGPYNFAAGDLDGNRTVDLAISHYQGSLLSVSLHENNLNGTLEYYASVAASCGTSRSYDIGIGDVNHDGLNDLVTSAGGNQPLACIAISYGIGGGEFASPATFPSYDIPEKLKVVDINRDGMDDIIVLHGGWLAIGIYFQLPNRTIADERLFTLPYASHYAPQGLAVGDFTGDGCPDVAIADYNHGLVTLRGSGCVILFADEFE